MRYEEFALRIWSKTEELFEFLEKPLTVKSREFLLNHTEKEKFNTKPKVWNTYRNPKESPFHWKTKLAFDKVMEVQHHCKNAMKLWGYRIATKTDLRNIHWNPLTQWRLYSNNLSIINYE